MRCKSRIGHHDSWAGKRAKLDNKAEKRQLSATHYFDKVHSHFFEVACWIGPLWRLPQRSTSRISLPPASDICEKHFPHIKHMEGLQVSYKWEARVILHQRPVVTVVLVGNLKMGKLSKLLWEGIHLLLVKHHVVGEVWSEVSTFSHLVAYPWSILNEAGQMLTVFLGAEGIQKNIFPMGSPTSGRPTGNIVI